MKIYLAGENAEAWKKRNYYNFNRLASFYYIKDEREIINKFNNFILDSGAYTFMTSMKNKNVNWDNYVISYAKFIKEYNVKNYFELDIDSIVGIKEVERLRKLLEDTSGIKCIPVWHKSRGLDYWKKMCKEYDYVAIGGLVTQEIKRTEYDVFYPLLKIAKENNTKVHGLGFTNLKGLEKYKFYSVDSTSWLSGNRFGAVYWFNGITMQKKNKEKGQRVKTNMTAINNFNEWVKFANYAENNL
jgi:hypothetical protein